ncbi:YtzC family protein [Bacillus lumedeiriae]|uniref:YtzC family protein n=1 Tax=Bacillus lumedeiriae TaxID=3058829 RepID=UPI00384BE619
MYMATRQSVEDCLQQCRNALEYAAQQYQQASMQEHDNDGNFVQGQLMLEEAYNDLDKLLLSANEQQREQLHRMRLQIQQMQNNMILLNH